MSLGPGGRDILGDLASLVGNKSGVNFTNRVRSSNFSRAGMPERLLPRQSNSSLDKSPTCTTTSTSSSQQVHEAIRSVGLDCLTTRDSEKTTFVESANYRQPTNFLKTPRTSTGKGSSAPLHVRFGRFCYSDLD